MKIIVLYRPASDHGRVVEEYLHDFTRNNPEIEMQILSVDTPDGAHAAELYDITAYPTLLAVRGDGELVTTWAGLPLPLMNEVAYYAFS